MKWYQLESSESFNLPEWVRTFGLDEQGVVFMAAAVTSSPESELYGRLDADADPDIPTAFLNDHLYLPCYWLFKEFPEIADICQMIELQAQKTLSQKAVADSLLG